jgi:hypothetical protein
MKNNTKLIWLAGATLGLALSLGGCEKSLKNRQPRSARLLRRRQKSRHPTSQALPQIAAIPEQQGLRRNKNRMPLNRKANRRVDQIDGSK